MVTAYRTNEMSHRTKPPTRETSQYTQITPLSCYECLSLTTSNLTNDNQDILNSRLSDLYHNDCRDSFIQPNKCGSVTDKCATLTGRFSYLNISAPVTWRRCVSEEAPVCGTIDVLFVTLGARVSECRSLVCDVDACNSAGTSRTEVFLFMVTLFTSIYNLCY